MIQKITVTSGTLFSIGGIGWPARVIRISFEGTHRDTDAFLSEQT
jgi:hypothetical protein